MRFSRMSLIVGTAAVALGSAGAAQGANLLPQGGAADVCPTVDERDTVDSVRAGLTKRLGNPLKEETLGTQYVLTYKQRDGSQLFVTLTRDNDKLEVSCDTAGP